jgi:hypothetical protein
LPGNRGIGNTEIPILAGIGSFRPDAAASCRGIADFGVGWHDKRHVPHHKYADADADVVVDVDTGASREAHARPAQHLNLVNLSLFDRDWPKAGFLFCRANHL